MALNDNLTMSDQPCENMSTTEMQRGIERILQEHCYPAVMIDKVVTPIWYIVGILGNVISAKIWLEKRMRRNNSSAVYLATLSINDTLFLLLHVLQEMKYAYQARTVDWPVICETYALVYLVVQYLAPALVLGFTVERFIAVCYPYQKHHFCTASRAIKVVSGMITGCFALCAIQTYFWTYEPETKECVVREAARKGEEISFWAIWSWVTEMVIFAGVPLLILFFNILVVREVLRMSSKSEAKENNGGGSVRHNGDGDVSANNSIRGRVPDPTANSNHHHHHHLQLLPRNHHPHHTRTKSSSVSTVSTSSTATNVMLLSVSFYVIFTTLPATLVYVLSSAFPEGCVSMTDEQIAQDSVWQQHFVYFTVRKIVDEICVSHYACNFFLFALTGREFRRSVRALLVCQRKTMSDITLATSKYYTVHRTDEHQNNYSVTKL